MKHFAADYEVSKAIARYEGIPYVAKKCDCWDGYCRVPGTEPCAPGSCEKCDTHRKKSSEMESQPFANPVPLAKSPGYTAGGEDIDEALENAPSAVGTGKESAQRNAFDLENLNLGGIGDIANQVLQSFQPSNSDSSSNFPSIQDIDTTLPYKNEDQFVSPDIDTTLPFKNQNASPSPNLNAFASAHKVEEKDDKFYVTEEGEGEVAGPFDSQEEAYSRANELNDLENLETEETHKEKSEKKQEGGFSVTITMAKALAMKEAALKRSSQGDKPSPEAAKAVLDALITKDEQAALDLLGETDCPEGCDTHPEGKCNHGYMAAGRTRVRYLVDSQAFKKSDEKPKEFGTTHYDSPNERG